MAKIMLVEDDNNLREIYEARLMAEGYEIVTARDGEEALAVAVKERPDLIISDVMMPKISGFDMLDILRSTPETKNVKVIMMTALSQVEDKERAAKLGADKYLVKSQVTLEDVAKVAREVLEGTTAAPVETAAPAADPVAPQASAEPTPAVAAPVVAAAAVAADPIVDAPVVTPVADTASQSVPTADPLTQPATVAAPVDPTPVPEPTTTTPPATTPTKVNITDLSDTPAPETPAAPEATPTADLTQDTESSLPPALQDNDIVKPASEVWTMDAAQPESNSSSPTTDTPTTPSEPVDKQKVDAAEARVEAVEPSSIEDEEAAIAKQIETMIGSADEQAASTESIPAPETTTEEPTVPTETPEPPAEEPAAPAAEEAPAPATPDTTSTPESPAEEPAKASGQKVIQPINDPTKQAGPDIHELAAKEEAIESQHTGGSVIAPSDQAAKDPNSPDPNSLAL